VTAGGGQASEGQEGDIYVHRLTKGILKTKITKIKHLNKG
jgi:hypothetical protein